MGVRCLCSDCLNETKANDMVSGRKCPDSRRGERAAFSIVVGVMLEGSEEVAVGWGGGTFGSHSSRTSGEAAKRKHLLPSLFRGGSASPDNTTSSNSPRSSSESIAETFWPADFLPQDVPNARIITYGYNSHITKFFLGATNQNHSINMPKICSMG